MTRLRNFFSNHLFTHPGHLIWIFLAYVPFLGKMSVPLTGDQKVYLNIALEMRQAGSWLKPILFGEGSYFKPPFQYWMTLIGWNVFGFNNWGAFLPSVFCTVATAWLIGELSLRLQGRRSYVNSGLLFAASLATVTYGTTAQMEIYVCFFYAAAWLSGLKYLEKEVDDRDNRWLYLAFAIAGFSSLVKSPLYAVFWVVGFLTYLLISGEWEVFAKKHLYLAWLLGVLCGLSWFGWMYKEDPQRFWGHYVVQETWNKKGGNESTFLSLWVALLYFFFPFTLLIVPAVRSAIQARTKAVQVIRFFIAWSWFPAVFFSLYPYRIKPYLFILLPALAIIVDWGFFRAARTKFFHRMLIASGLMFFIAMSILAFVILRAQVVGGWIGVGFCVAGILGLIAALKDGLRVYSIAALGAVLCFRIAAIQLGESDIRSLRDYLNHHPQDATRLALWDERQNIWHEFGLISVTIENPVKRLDSEAQVLEHVQTGGVVILHDGQTAQMIPKIDALCPGKMQKTRWNRWRVRAQFPYRDLILYGRNSIPDFMDRATREFLIVSCKR